MEWQLSFEGGSPSLWLKLEDLIRTGVMMNFNDQDRQCCVTLSAAKGLARWAGRCFAALSMTGPVLIVKNHHHARTHSFHPQGIDS